MDSLTFLLDYSEATDDEDDDEDDSGVDFHEQDHWWLENWHTGDWNR